MSRFIYLVLVLILASCGTASQAPTPVPPATPTQGPSNGNTGADPSGDWQVVSLNGQPVVGNQPLTLGINNGQAGGHSGCNQFGGAVNVMSASNEIAFQNLASTLMGCEPMIANQEAAYTLALQNAKTYKVEGDTLTLFDQTGAATVILQKTASASINPTVDPNQPNVRQPMPGQPIPQPMPAQPSAELPTGSWQVVTINTLAVGGILTLELQADQASGNAGCNQFNGSVSITPQTNEISFSPLATTKMGCSDARITQQETSYLHALELTRIYQFTGDTLTLFNGQKEEVVTLRRVAGN